MERIEFESFWFVCPCFADVFVERQALEGFEATTKIVSVHEVGKMAFELFVAVVVETLGGRLFDGSVHAFQLAIRSGVFNEKMVDIVRNSCAELSRVLAGDRTASPLAGDEAWEDNDGRS